MDNQTESAGRNTLFGVGLRHPHYRDVLNCSEAIDFVEVHAENFYMEGGMALALLQEVRAQLEVSVHATSLGLGTMANVPDAEIQKLKRLVDLINPVFVSDHAAFSWSPGSGQLMHAGDLLPLAYNQQVVEQFSSNVDRVQQTLGRRLLIENLAAYIALPGSSMTEFEFLQTVSERTGCGLLVDINNIYVNAVNSGVLNPLAETQGIIDGIDAGKVQQLHLAGNTPASPGQPLIDDHGRAVSAPVWEAYRHTVTRMGRIPTLVEWDNNIPEWIDLLQEARKARQYGDHHG